MDLRYTSDSSRWWVVLGKGEATAGQYVLLFQVLEFQDIDLTPDYCWRRGTKFEFFFFIDFLHLISITYCQSLE